MEWKDYPHQFEGLDKYLSRIREKKSRLDALRPLPTAALQNLRNSLALEWTYHSNSIEGNTVLQYRDLRERKRVKAER